MKAVLENEKTGQNAAGKLAIADRLGIKMSLLTTLFCQFFTLYSVA
jgi:hypothetical protein